MLTKKLRLPMAFFVRSGKKHTITTPFFTVKTSPNGLSYNRYGIIVSKKIDKRSTVRNRIKREFVGLVQEAQKQGEGLDRLFIIRKNYVGKSKEELKQSLISTLQKLHSV